MMRRVLGTLLVIALVGVAANDAWRIGAAERHLRSVTYALTRWAAENAHDMGRDQAAAQLVAMGQAEGVTLYAYDQTEKAVRVYTSADVAGTVLAGPVYNLVEGAGPGEAFTKPLTLRDHRDAGFAR